MKTKLLSNSYDSNGWYLSPDIETKSLEIVLSDDEFLMEYFNLIKIPSKYHKVLFIVFKYRDKAGVFEISELKTYLQKESYKVTISEFKKTLNYLALNGLRQFGEKIIFYDWELKVWRINKLFLYKDWSIKNEIKNK